MEWTRRKWTCAASGALLAAACAARSAGVEEAPSAAAEASFTVVAEVLRHPRCLNCHPTGDVPRVGDAALPHPQNVARGVGGRGWPGMQCQTCHQERNQPLAGVPGAPNWHLAPLSMGWEGLDDHELAEALKDPSKNGSRSLEEIVDHFAHDPLVGWAWDPGPGRELPPVSRAEFVARAREWVAAGAPSPPATRRP